MTTTERISSLCQERGLVKAADLKLHGLPPEYLSQLHRRGVVERVGRGLYRHPDAILSKHHSLAEAAQRVSKGVVCLLSALRFHDLTTQAPFEVWMMIDHKAKPPRSTDFPLRIVYSSEPARDAEYQTHLIEGIEVRVTNPAKTITDCFKYRNKIGLDVAIEALRDCHSKKLASIDEIWHSAKANRVANVMRPYLEML